MIIPKNGPKVIPINFKTSIRVSELFDILKILVKNKSIYKSIKINPLKKHWYTKRYFDYQIKVTQKGMWSKIQMLDDCGRIIRMPLYLKNMNKLENLMCLILYGKFHLSDIRRYLV